MYRIVCLTYKSLNGMTPDYLTNLFKPLSTVSQRQTRSTANRICGCQTINYQSLGVDLNILGHIFTLSNHQRYGLRVHFLHESREHTNCF